MVDPAHRFGQVVIDPTRVPAKPAPTGQAPPVRRCRVVTLPGVGVAVAAWLLELGLGLVAAVGIAAVVWFTLCH